MAQIINMDVWSNVHPSLSITSLMVKKVDSDATGSISSSPWMGLDSVE